MICLATDKPTYDEFRRLMQRTNAYLNDDAAARYDYYRARTALELERDVADALEKTAANTPFDGSIQLLSGAGFPDIVAARYYGVEVKSVKSDHWTTTGGSINESTRREDVERIYLTFGKLGGHKVEFISKPYEACLSDIVVTHMPRYKINMELGENDTIFNKLGTTYDDFRKCGDQIGVISRYYRARHKQLWWTRDPVEEAVSVTIRKWCDLDDAERSRMASYALANFTELYAPNSTTKYERFAMYLMTRGVYHSSMRDIFSAGGRHRPLLNGVRYDLPAVFKRVGNYFEQIYYEIQRAAEGRHDRASAYARWAREVCDKVEGKDKQAVASYLNAEYTTLRR